MIAAALLALQLALDPATSSMAPGSGLYTRAENGAALIGFQLVVAAGTAREGRGQNGLAALAAETLLRTPVDGVSVLKRVDVAGGTIQDEVEPNVVRFTVEALPAALPGIASALARAIQSPDTSTATIAAARAALQSRIDEQEENPILVGLDMLRESYYAGGAGAPDLGSSTSLAGLAATDVAAFLGAHYVRGNAFMTATGHVDQATEAAARTLLDAFPAGVEAPPDLSVKPFAAAAKRVVTHRDVGVPFVLLGFAAPALGDNDFAAMLVFRALVEGIATRAEPTTPPAYELPIEVVYDYDRKPASIAIVINGSELDPSTGVTVVETILKTAIAKPLSPDVIQRYRDVAHGQWDLDGATLTDRAQRIGSAVLDGADPSAPEAVDAAIDAVTPADVQRIAKAYLQRYTLALVLPRAGS